MDSKLLLVKCITLLFRESQLPQSNSSVELCREVVDAIRLPEATMEVNNGREVLIGLRSTLLWMMDQDLDGPFDKQPLLQQIKINTKDEEYLYQSFILGVEDVDEETILKEITHYRRELRSHLRSADVSGIVKKAFNTMFHDGNLDYTEFSREIVAQLEPYTHKTHGAKIDGVVDSMSLDSDEDVEKYLTQAVDEISGEGVLRTGWQALNRMCGDQGGFRRGELVMVPALPHNFKTGLVLNLGKHIALYNTPFMRDEKKTPLILVLTAENEISTNMLFLYANLKENETGELVNTRDVDPIVARQYVQEKLQATGYKFQMVRVDPSNFGIYEYTDVINDFESKGYEIHAVIIDYLQMFNKKGCNQGPHGTEIRDLFRRVRNIGAPRGITTITPHQLSSEAKTLMRQNPERFLAEIANKGYYDSCRTVDQEIDLEIYIHIAIVDGHSYLEFHRGKHRRAGPVIPEKDKSFTLPFRPIGGVVDDLHDKDTSLRSPGGSGKNDDEFAFWE